jgi:hypothetical protein
MGSNVQRLKQIPRLSSVGTLVNMSSCREINPCRDVGLCIEAWGIYVVVGMSAYAYRAG